MQKAIRIIVADDDSDDQYFINQALKELAFLYQVKAVYNGLELLDHLKQTPDPLERPDLIILDLNMPLLDGYAVLDQLQKDRSLCDIPVFILSTSRFEHDRIKAKALGARAFYSKPYRFEELKELVREICEKADPAT